MTKISDKQQTLQDAISFYGVGLHTGKVVAMTFVPAAENFGIKFKRMDLAGQPTIDADVNNVVDSERATVLRQNHAEIHTVEHVLAALIGLGIDNLLIEIDNEEAPILDGSAIKFVEAIEKMGIVELQADKVFYELNEEIRYYDPIKDAEFIATPYKDYRITTMVDYKSTIVGSQFATMNNIDEFKTEIASCRTFCFLDELEQLVKHNLIKGGDLDNAIVIVDKFIESDKLNELKKLFNKPDLEINKQGILSNIELHYQNEPARHKLLDIVGDLALIGTNLKAHIIASKPGHSSNVAFAKIIKEHIKKQRSKQHIPKYNPNQKPIYDINQVMEMLPHRYPFVMVDKIIEIGEKHIVGVKNVSFNEPYFEGHFPNNPVMPGVLQIEAMAQTGGILCLQLMGDPSAYWTYFLKIENAKFKDKVLPGDTLVFYLELLEPIRRGICLMQGYAYVGEKLVSEAVLMAQLVKK